MRLMICLVFFTAVVGAHQGAAQEAVRVTVTVDLTQPGLRVPKAFMGFSHEWSHLPQPDGGPASQVHPAYLRLLEQLCAFNDGALSIRIGGNSADGMGTVPEEARWRQYGEVFRATRTPLIINLNLARKKPELDKEVILAAQRWMPAGAVETFELGNEPDGWQERYKPKDYGFENYLGDFGDVAKELVPTLTPGLAGPAWAHGAPPEILAKFLAAYRPLINLITVHSYRFNPKSHPKLERLLDDRETAGYAAKLVPGIKVAHDAGLKIRLTEAGSAWSGGIAGFSDSFAASLWTLDVFYELAKAGLDGVNLHGGGMSHYSPIHDQTNKATGRTTITASAPFYGMLVFAEATADGARLLPVSASGEGKVKVWATTDRKGIVRVVATNRDATKPAEIVVHVPGAAGKGTLKRLEATSAVATSGFRYAGRTYDGSADGNPVGGEKAEDVSASEAGGMRFTLAPVSVGLLMLGPGR